MKQKVRLISQIIFLILFVLLLRMGKLQIWMGFILGSVLLAIVFNRNYCGWICPINTFMRPVEWLKKKLKLKSNPNPQWAKSSVLRYTILIVVLVILFLTITKGVKLPLMLILIPIAIFFTLFFPSVLWHRYLCPYGIIFSLTAGKSLFGVRVHQSNCISCGLCVGVCPTESVSIPGKKKPAVIDSKHCLTCFDCQDICPKDTIIYSRYKKDKSADKGNSISK